MQPPPVRYATSGDVKIAYQVTGEGNPVDLVRAPSTVSHLDLDWEDPSYVRYLERLSRFARLIRFDKRGSGLSDRPTDVNTLEERMDDIRAVMDAAGGERAFILGSSEGASMACLFAAMYPERTLGLILFGVQARWTKSEDYPWGLSAEEWERMIADLEEHGPTDEYIFGYGVPDDVDLEAERRYYRAAANPAAYALLERMNMAIDTRDILPTIRVPTLVMNRTGDPVADVDAARAVAAGIPGARFLEFPGDTHSIWYPDPEPILAEIEEFVTGARPAPQVDRVLATVLFADIVGSTERAAELGDRRWKGLLAAHYEIVRRELARFRGREVDTAGDGFLATFDGPARAVRCGRAIAEAVQRLGITVRSGAHSGECELMGEKVGGIAVHIGARVAARAGPGEVLVSSTVKDLVVGSGLVFEDRGVHALKGVPDEWRLFAAVGDEQA